MFREQVADMVTRESRVDTRVQQRADIQNGSSNQMGYFTYTYIHKSVVDTMDWYMVKRTKKEKKKKKIHRGD